MSPLRTINSRLLFSLAVGGSLTAGILLRGWSFSQNTRLYGDVNLFALTARQLVWSRQLSYPMKYDYTPQVDYLTLESPASQHPPLWSLLAALLARFGGTQDTFLTLKVLSLLVGLGLWLAFFPKPSPSSSWTKLIPFTFIAFSPWLVDFSTNGSPYILVAFLLLLAEQLWKSDHFDQRISLVLAALVCAIALLTHYNLILLPISFATRIITQKNLSTPKKWLNGGSFFALYLFFLSPWLAWNQRTFGQWFHSPSTYYLLEQLKLAHLSSSQEQILWTVESQPLADLIPRYSLLLAKSAWAGMRQFLEMLTPPGVLCLLVALTGRGKQLMEGGVIDRVRQGIRLLTAPGVLYLLTILFWATYKTRFLIPFLPISYRLIGDSIGACPQLTKGRKRLIGLVLSLVLVWSFLPYRQKPLNLYYGRETPSFAQLYDQMKPLADQLAKQPRGVVLGVSNSLDGGIETIYWARQPFVMGRGMDEALWKKLSTDFSVRYVWAECPQERALQQIFPTSEILLTNDRYCVFTLR